MNVGIIGSGNMGGAILRGYIASGADAARVRIYDKAGDKAAALARECGVTVSGSVAELLAASDIVVLTVKPNDFETVLPEAAVPAPNQVIVSPAAGISIAYIEGFTGADKKIVRIMPNTPAAVGASMMAVSANARVTEADLENVTRLLSSVGRVEIVPEDMMDVVTGLSGSSPAYAYMFVDALTAEAVRGGMEKEKARRFAAQALLGAAKMVLETGTDPVTLRENVCSPGGTTIEAVRTLTENGFEACVAAGMRAAVEKSKKLTK